MTPVSALAFDAAIVTFDDRRNSRGLVLAATRPLSAALSYTAYVRYPDGRFAWLSSSAVWAWGGQPWALVQRFDATADEPALPGGPAVRVGGGEIRITDDLDAGLRALDPRHTPRRPRRVAATGSPASTSASTWSVLVEDGVDEAAPSMITVLDAGGAVPSGLCLSAPPMLATRLLADTGALRASVSDPLDGIRARGRSCVPGTMLLRAVGPE
ncbi:MAG: hypothetical protein QM602_05845 [Microbacterium sp.]